MLVRILVLLGCLITSGLIYAQAPTQAPTQTPTDDVIKVDTNLVSLDVQVLNTQTNTPVSGLKKEDFRLFDEQHRQEITFFKEETHPLSIILLFESSTTLAPLLQQLHPEEWPINQYLKPEDEVSIMAFGEHVEVVQGFTKDKRAMIKGISRLPQLADRQNYIRQAIYQATQQMKRAINPVGRRAIIVITSNFSKEPLIAAGNIATKDETFTQLYESGATVTSLIFGGLGSKLRQELAGRVYPDQILFSKLFSKSNVGTFAKETGGEVATITAENFLAKLSTQLEYLRTGYSLAFIPEVSRDNNAFREISLKLAPETTISKDHLVIKTRRGYYPNHPSFVSYSQRALPKLAAPGAVVRPYQVVNLMPQFWQFWESSKDQDIAAQTERFRELLIKPHPEIFNPMVLNIPPAEFDKTLDRDIHGMLFDLKTHLPQLRRLSNQLANELNLNEDKFLSRFPDLKWHGTIYFLPALTAFVTKEAVVQDQASLLIGLDTIAFTYKDDVNLWPIFHHQLFHLYHQQFQPSSHHLNLTQPLYQFIWAEGLACYVVNILDPEVPKGEVLQLDTIKGAPKTTLPLLAQRLRPNLDIAAEADYHNYFALDTNAGDSYVNSGNYLGLLIAEKLVLSQSLNSAIQLQGDELRTSVDFLLRRIALGQLK